MVRRSFPFFLLLISLFLFAGCTSQTIIPTEDDHGSWVNFSDFQSRFDPIPDGITCAPWQTKQQGGSNTIYSTVLSCAGGQCQHILEVTTNSDRSILNISLQSKTADRSVSCFAEVSYHVFCAMGFQDKDAKGNTVFADADAFYAYFQMLSHQDTEQSMWINCHEVTYVHPSDSETRCFMIRCNA